MGKRRPLRQRVRSLSLLVSWLLFPLTIFYFSPYLIVAAAAMGTINGSFIVFGLMLLAALVFGRAYCGWVCPAAGLQEAAEAINPAPVPGWLGRVKWVIWGLWMALIAALAILSGGYRRVDVLFSLDGGVSYSAPSWYAIYLGVNGLALGLAAFAGRRGFCHAACWMAPFMVLGRRLGDGLRLPGLRLRADPGWCTGCQTCTRGCPMTLPVAHLVQAGDLRSDDCILCGTCVDSCTHGVISFTFGGPVATATPARAQTPDAGPRAS
ncbi:MAG: 4Fe-4S binding protein [Chloroflexales bacterium]|nr:4Fe-4S binding protein [Chloroflexales bacterium]